MAKSLFLSVLFIAYLAGTAIATPGTLATPVIPAMPGIPEDARAVFYRAFHCDNDYRPDIYVLGYDTDGKPELFEIAIFGFFQPDGTPIYPPIIWFFYTPGVEAEKPDRIIRTLPRREPEELSWDQLLEEYGLELCGMMKHRREVEV